MKYYNSFPLNVYKIGVQQSLTSSENIWLKTVNLVVMGAIKISAYPHKIR